MSFKFDFAEDSDSDFESTPNYDGSSSPSANPPTFTSLVRNPLDDITITSSNKPNLFTLKDILSSSAGVRISYSDIKTNSGVVLSRRDLFDVKFQLMLEEDMKTKDKINKNEDIANDGTKLMSVLDNEDLRRDIYEGGLKMWESTLDLIDFLDSDKSNWNWNWVNDKSEDEVRILELGCGTALPSVYLFENFLKTRFQIRNNDESDEEISKQPKIRFTLADFNYPVIKYVTAVNIIIAWSKSISSSLLESLQKGDNEWENIAPPREGELQITSKLINFMIEDLQKLNIVVDFVSGGWSKDFIDLISQTEKGYDLILGSETIYEPKTIPLFVEMLLKLGRPSPNKNKIFKNRSLVAAKNIYFGVGGGTREFTECLDSRIRETELNIKHKTVFEIKSQGVARSIIEVSLV